MRSTSRSPGFAACLAPSITTPTTAELSTGAVPFTLPFTTFEVCMVVTHSPTPVEGVYNACQVLDAGARVLGLRVAREGNRTRIPDHLGILVMICSFSFVQTAFPDKKMFTDRR